MDQFAGKSVGDGDNEMLAMLRGKARAGIALIGQLQLAERPNASRVRIRNLSTGGLMADFDEPVEIGTMVDVGLGGVGTVRGRVAWTTAGRIGIAFERPIDPLSAPASDRLNAQRPRRRESVRPGS